MEIAETSEVSLRMVTNSFPRDGSATRKAWGTTTWRCTCRQGRPSARAASPCPATTDRRPPRWISAM